MKTDSIIKFAAIVLAIFFLGKSPACNGTESTNEFPSDEAEYNNANPKVIWGEATNFLRGDHMGGNPVPTSLRSTIDVSNGVIMLSGHPLKVMHPAHLYIENSSATNIALACMPPVNERFVLTMTDANGVPVPKTPEGQALGQFSSLKPNTRWIDLPRVGTGIKGTFGIFPKQLFQMAFSDKIGAGISIPSQEVAKMFELDPTKYFIIQKPGLYKLAVIPRLYMEDTNTYLKIITLPPVTMDVLVEKDSK
jgi:hypothetical protein